MIEVSKRAERPTAGGGVLSPSLAVRSVVGGVLMGLANLVPGISGGTMLVAAGIYTRFIDAISDLTRLRFRVGSVALLGIVVASAGVAIVLGAAVITHLLTSARWAMYAAFIGLTLGGLPILLKLARPLSAAAWAGIVAGVVVMLGLVWLQSGGAGGGGGRTNMLLLGLAGVAGASAMILPGVSGAFLLLLLGQYRPILESISRAKDAASARDLSLLMGEAGVIVPVGVGVVVGIAVVSNLLRFALHRYEKATLGVLIGLLIAAPAGLYPFKEGVRPEVGDVIAGQTVTGENLAEFRADPKDWPERVFAPTGGHLLVSAWLATLGASLTIGLSLLSAERKPRRDQDAEASEDAASG